jgi:predicted nuclease of predicted toxin-antitoxin system
MKLKFLADPLFPEATLDELKSSGYDAEHAADIGAGDLPNLEILRLAAFEDRVVLTLNQGLARLAETTRECPSIVLFRQRHGTPEAMGRMLLSLLPLFNEDLASGAMVVIRDDQTLLRKFPRTRG